MQPVLLAVQWLLLLLLVGALVGFVSSLHRRPGTAPAAAAGADTAEQPPQWWRCNECESRWRSHDVRHVSTLGLRVRRSLRRRARAGGRTAPAWTSARGSTRCPSCLSRSIRPSRQQR